MSMIYRALDSNKDYVFGKNAQSFNSGTVAVSQAIYTRLKLLKAEWWENTEDGLPLFQSILGKSGTPENIASIDLLIHERIAETKGVINIKSFSSTYQNRQYNLNCIVETEYGDATLEVTF